MAKTKRYSAKREAILEILRHTDTHPTAEWVYQQLKPAFPDLSLGTVYRNLTAFRQEGLIISVGVVNGQERFDAEVTPHTHFICEHCGGVYDLFDLAVPEELVSAPSRLHGLHVERYHLTFQGTCGDCLEKDAQAG